MNTHPCVQRRLNILGKGGVGHGDDGNGCVRPGLQYFKIRQNMIYIEKIMSSGQSGQTAIVSSVKSNCEKTGKEKI